MDQPLKQSHVARQYRLATFVVVIGALSLGVLLLGRFTELYYESIFFYYGLQGEQFQPLREVSSLSLTIGHLCVAALALIGTLGFVAAERRRLRRLHAHRCSCHSAHRVMAVSSLSRADWLATLVKRTAVFSTLLLATWIAQTTYERVMGGYGWTPASQYSDWTSVLPLTTIFLMCVLVGLGVAAISMFGLRAIVALRQAFAATVRRRRTRRPGRLRHELVRVRTARELYGLDILSRPPPPGVCAA